MTRHDLHTHIELEDHGPVGPVTTDLLNQTLTELESQGQTSHVTALLS